MYGMIRRIECVCLRCDTDTQAYARMYGMARVRAANSAVRAMEECYIRSEKNNSRILTRDSFPSVMFNSNGVLNPSGGDGWPKFCTCNSVQFR